nr:hypothetical protein [uncultured Rhodococcus sp.]
MSSNFGPVGPASIPVRARTCFPVGTDASDSVLLACSMLSAGAVTGGTVLVRHWPDPARNAESVFLDALDSMGCYVVAARDGLTVTTRSTAGRYDGLTASVGGAGILAPLIVTLACLADSESLLVAGTGCAAVIDALRSIGADIDVDGVHVTIRPAVLAGGEWSAIDRPGTLCGLILQLRIPDLDVDARGLGTQQSAFLAEWNRVRHADEFLLPGSAKLPHNYL